MTTLRLGVINIPYAGNGSKATSISTGDVAEILEAKYHIMEVFFETAKQDIADALAESVAGAIESILQGSGNGPPPFAEAEGAIKERFDRFISLGEMESLGYPGVPTKAAIEGISHRLKHPYAKGNPRRVSFVDTGLYLASFAAEIDG